MKSLNCIQCGATAVPNCKYQQDVELCNECYAKLRAEEISQNLRCK